MFISAHPRLRRLVTRAVAVLAVSGLVGTTGAAYAADGIDVSRWQHGTSIDWTDVKADGVSFAFIKATEGSSYTNSYFRSDRAATREVGIYRGAYHFARPSVGSAAAQARYFVSVAGKHGRRGDLPPVLDLEADGGLSDTALQEWTRTWLETVEELTGRTPIIYTGPYFWETEMGDSSAFHRYPLWIAHYSTSSPRVPGDWPKWTFWQTSQTGHVDGISGDVDLNRFHGTRRALARLAQAGPVDNGDAPPGTGTTPPEPPAEPEPEPEPTPEPTVPAPKTATAVSLDLSRPAVFRGRRVDLSGRLTTSEDRGLRNRRVGLYRRAEGSREWTRIASLTTGPTGEFAARFAISGAATFKVVFGGNRRFVRTASELETVTVRPKITTEPTLALEKTAGRGNTVKLYGHLRTTAGKAVVGRTMRLYQRPAGSSRWRLVADSQTLAPTGWYQTYVSPSRTTTYRAVFGGTRALTRSVSNLTTVRVR